jgi:hypothetical protein
MKKGWATDLCSLAVIVFALPSCDGTQTCTQGNVDECYLSVGCDGSQNCMLTTDRMNTLCACLGDLGCDQPWYHTYCDGAPYEDGECCFCDEEPDGGSCD